MTCKCNKWRPGITPHIDKNAKPSAFGNVSGTTIIEVQDATYRGSGPFNGLFEMVNVSRDPRRWRGLRVEVYCCWHGVKPPTTFPNIVVKKGKYKIFKRKGSCRVVRNLS